VAVQSPPLTLSQWPADATEPIRDTTVGSVLREAARRRPDAFGLVAGMPEPAARRRWTYSEMLEEAERAARALLGRFDPGDRIAVWAPNVPEWELLEMAAALAGVVLVTVNPAYRPAELEYVLRQSRSAGIFALPEWRGNQMLEAIDQVRGGLPELREVVRLDQWDAFCASALTTQRLPDVGPDDAAQIQYTSGTTGFPKGALLHHRGITNNARLTGARCGLSDSDVWVNSLPMFHTSGCVLAALGAMQCSGVHVNALFFDPALVLELAETERATVVGAVPTMLIALLDHPDVQRRDLSSLRIVISGGSPVPAELVRRAQRELQVQVSVVFGQTEASPVVTQTRLDDTPEDIAETVGQPLPQTEVRIADTASGDTVPVGTIGEICTRGYLVMHGYFDMPEATAAAIDGEGWLHTGDLGTMDSRGYCKVEGRLKDMIIRGGENIYPREIEEVLFTHPAIADVAVVGVPDEHWGEQVAAFVRAAPGATIDEAGLAAFVRQRLAVYKAPRHWIVVDEFPLTPSGKVQKFVLRERFVQNRGGR